MLCFLETWAPPIKEIILTIAAIVGSVVAVIGLTTWRKQIGGTAKYELARRLLKEVYQFREALQSVRFPFMSVKEMGLLDEAGLAPTDDKEKRYSQTAKEYQHRYIKVDKARSALEATLLEVEVLWGASILSKVRKLYNWDGELYAAIMEHLDTIISDAPGGGRTPADKARTRSILYSRGNKKKDEFLKGLQQDIEEVEKDIRPHLKRFV